MKLDRKKHANKIATVKKVLKIWETDGIQAVKTYLNNKTTKVYTNTWVEKIKNLLNEGLLKSTEKEIELISFNLNINKNKSYGKEKE